MRKIKVISFGRTMQTAQIVVIENGVSHTKHLKRFSPTGSLWYDNYKTPFSNTMLGIK